MSLVVVGCGEKKDVDYNAIMQEQATQYYVDYQKEKSGPFDAYTVSLEALKQANEYGKTYALDDLKDCKDSSYVNININKTTWEVTSYDFHMECE
jgi:hypothetical protein